MLVPSLALLRQIKNDWAKQKSNPYHYISVCSEKDINSEEADSLVSHSYEVGGFVSTDPKEVFSFLNRNVGKVVFSTYQSLPVIIESIKDSDFKFDLILCDEAHKTAGTTQGLFGLVHDNIKLPAARRLYMTATPRVVSDTLKQRATNDDEFLYDMNDAKIFGEEIYRMSFKDAIEKNILVDYKIIAIGVKDSELREFIEERRYAGSDEFTMEDWANNYALEIVMKKYNANHAITFHSRVTYAKKFSERHAKLFKEIDSFYVSGEQHTSERAIILNQFKTSEKSIVANARCLTEGVDVPAIDLVYFCDPKNSKVDIVQASGRALRLDHSRNKQIGYIVVPVFHVNQDKVEDAIVESQFRNLISIIRSLCDQDERLQEEINSIAFGKGKKSKSSSHIEVSFELKQEEKIFLEGFGEKLQNSIFDQIIDRTARSWDLQFMKFKEYLETNTIDFVWDSHELNWEENFEKLKEYRLTHEYEPSKEDDAVLSQWLTAQKNDKREDEFYKNRRQRIADLNFKGSLQDRNWEENFEKLKEYRLSHDYEPSKEENAYLYQWLQIQKGKKENEEIYQIRKQRIADLNFKGNFQDKVWDETFDLLISYLKENNYKYPSQRNKEPVAHRLGVWFLRIRSDYKKGLLEEYRLAKLNSINFPFEPFEYRWDEFYEKLKKWFVTNEEFPSRSDNEDIYNWLRNQVDKFVNKTLDESKRKLLEELNFKQFIDRFENKKTDEKIWDDTFQEVRKFKELNDCFPIYGKKNKNEIESRLGVWLVAQRQKYKKGKLPPEQIQKLAEIGFDWRNANEVLEEAWENKFQALTNFYEENKRWPTFNEGSIGQWCAAQRNWLKGQSQNTSEYPKERKEKLDLIGFPWEPNAHDETWDEKYQKVKNYFVENNTDKLPVNINGKGNNLYSWLMNQKMFFKKGKLESDRIEKLKEIGIDFENEVMLERNTKSWDENFIELKSQMEKGIFKSTNEDGSTPVLYRWLTRQKAIYKHGNLEKEKVNLLKEIGFDLENESETEKIEKTWDENFALLKKQIENGNLKSKDEKSENVRNYWWLKRQKRKYKEGNLEKEKFELLQSIGIDFENNRMIEEKSWGEYFLELKSQVETGTFKSTDGKGNTSAIYNWLKRQKAKYKEGILEKEKIKILSEIGIDLGKDQIFEKNDKSWNEYFVELKNQIEQGNFKSTDENGRVTKLYKWFTRQKQNTKKEN
ncbi:MAG: Helicase associated domain protein [Leptospiraceae bacterium]|nr:Helicase associated domain protein [Leptospiraceae bacterium]